LRYEVARAAPCAALFIADEAAVRLYPEDAIRYRDDAQLHPTTATAGHRTIAPELEADRRVGIGAEIAAIWAYHVIGQIGRAGNAASRPASRSAR
jgi:hypothetical protein